MENCIHCNELTQVEHSINTKKGLLKRIIDLIDTHPIEGAELWSRIK